MEQHLGHWFSSFSNRFSVHKFNSKFLDIDKLYATYLFPYYFSLLPLLTIDDEFVLTFSGHFE
jgi:hypothetical protein